MVESLDLLVVFPNNRERAFGALMTEIAAVTPPVEAALLVAYVRQRGYAAGLLDADQNNLSPAATAEEIRHAKPGLVCVCTDSVNTGDVTKMAAASDLLRVLRAGGCSAPIVLQGIVPSAYPEEILRREGPDYVCQGEPYVPVAELTGYLRRASGRRDLPAGGIRGIWMMGDGEVLRSERSAPMSVEELPMTPWELMPPSGYRAHHWHCFDRLQERSPYACIYTGFGCPYNCSFCSVNTVAGKPNHRPRSVSSVLAEIDLLVRRYNVRSLRILDNVFTLRLDLVEALCDALIARGYDLNMWAYARVESVKNPEILIKMKRAGVNWLAYGIEAAAERVRTAVRKASSQTTIDKVVEWTQRAGIAIVGNFIFGLPEDDRETMQMSLDMAMRYNFEWANFYCAMAYPGTPLYDQALKDHIELPSGWSGFGQYSADAKPLPTKHLKWYEVLDFRDEAFRVYYTNPAYLDMIRSKYGSEAVALIRRILDIPLVRNRRESNSDTDRNRNP